MDVKCWTVPILWLLLMMSVDSLRILVVDITPTKSHHIVGREVASILADHHDVTFFSAFSTPNAKFRDIPITELQSLQNLVLDKNVLVGSKYDQAKSLANWIPLLNSKFLESEAFKEICNNESEHFDVVISEYFLNQPLLGLGVRFKCPTILLSPIAMTNLMAEITGNPLSLARVPNLFSTYTGHMNYFQRIVNFIMYISQKILLEMWFDFKHEEIYNKYFHEESKRVPYNDLSSVVSGAILNSHPSTGISRPFLQNVIEVAGFHVRDDQVLPNDIQQILDNSINGAIYFSLGSSFQSTQIDTQTLNSIISVFGTLNHTILWKYEGNLTNLPENIFIKEWMPQTAILAHPNLKMFITHCGLLSYIESLYFGVPIIAIPLFGDQHHNAYLAQENELGIVIDYKNISLNSLSWATNEILNNTKYTNSAQKLRTLFHDRPISPKNLITYYVELIARYHGNTIFAPVHLSSLSNSMLDIILPMFLVFLLVCYIFIIIVSWFVKKMYFNIIRKIKQD